LRDPGSVDYTFANFPINLSDRLIAQQEAIEALNNQMVTGVSMVANFNNNILITPTENPRTMRFQLNASYIRCNKVLLTWFEDDDGVTGGSESIDLDVTVDGTLVGHGVRMIEQDITLYLTTTIIGTQHTILFDYHGISVDSCIIQATVACQVFRRPTPL
jgi:hypothetical protein